MKQKQTAFTLIELLVVIVIVGILATISTATYSGALEKARLGKAQFAAGQVKKQFLAENASSGTNLFTAWYGADEVGDINATSPFVIDKSEAQNHLTHYGTGTLLFSQSDDTGSGVGKSIRIENSAHFRWSGLETINDPVNKITMATWVKFEDFGSYYSPGTRFFQFSNAIGLKIYNDGAIAFYIAGHADLKASKVLEEDKWYYIVGSYNGDTEEINIWIDGDLVATQGNVEINNLINDRNIYVGDLGRNFNGWLDEVMIFPFAFDGEELK